jgi:hypothetical protein
MLKEQQPRTRQNKELIDMLRRSRLFRDYENVFTKATGLPLTLRPLEFWQLAHHGKKNENPFCALLAERPATLAVCLKAHAYRRHSALDHLSFRFNGDGDSCKTRLGDYRLLADRSGFAPCAD